MGTRRLRKGFALVLTADEITGRLARLGADTADEASTYRPG